jgi:hypothetical protein
MGLRVVGIYGSPGKGGNSPDGYGALESIKGHLTRFSC